MNIPPYFRIAGLIPALLLLATSFQVSAVDDRFADDGGSILKVDRPEGAGAAQMVLVGPDGSSLEFRFSADEAVILEPETLAAAELTEGQYVYEVRFAPGFDGEGEANLVQRTDSTADTLTTKSMPTRSGTFRILGDGLMAVPQKASEVEPSQQDGDSDGGTRDYVINDDLIVMGSTCIGFDCVNGETFSFDTLKLKENNNRFTFIDTSTAAGFAAGSWQLRANDSASGGADHFSIDWLGTDANTGDVPVSTPFRVDGSAPSNAIRVASTGQVGLRTATPVTDLHMASSNTPTIRLEQTSSGGFTPQTWDMAGNEANFFVRDVTGGSLLPFRIRPGAPTSSIDIRANGNVGIGTNSPAAKLHVANGDVRVDGSVYQLSSRAMKTDFGRFDPAMLLDLLGNLELGTWHYRHDLKGGRHFGPAAEDFHEAFGLGDNAQSISLADMAGVALGAAQALKQEIEERDARIEALTERLERLERALESQLAGAKR